MTVSGSGLPLSRSLVDMGVFSVVVNLLLLISPLYLVQVYDRVLVSSSISTLLYLTLLAVAGLVVLGILDVVRALYANRLAARFEVRWAALAFVAAIGSPRAGLGDVQPLRDLAVLRNFVASRALFFLFDLPFGPFFLILLYFIHPLLFAVALVGAVVLVAVSLLNQFATKSDSKEAGELLAATMNSAQTFARNFETVRALGMVSAATESWAGNYSKWLGMTDRLGRTNALFGGLSRTIRMIVQLAVLGTGAYLVLRQQMTAGTIFAASIITGRAFQPLDQIVGSWRQIAEARQAWQRIAALQAPGVPSETARPDLPPPTGALTLDQLVYFPPNVVPGGQPLIKRVSFAASAGECVAIIGPSQAGKSTLARLIVGAISPHSGVVRVDGSDIQNLEPDQLGKHMGYLSQEVELFPGTISQNIARFEAGPPATEIVAAAERAQVHDLILRLPQGYSTVIGPAGVRLSGGERQRIGLARALYGRPAILVLDEPNANLDPEGEAALERAVIRARAEGRTVVIVTHRPSIAAKCDTIVVLRDGEVKLHGPAREVLNQLGRSQNGDMPRPVEIGSATLKPGSVPGLSATAANSKLN